MMNRRFGIGLGLVLVWGLSPLAVRAAVLQVEPIAAQPEGGQAPSQEETLYANGTKAMDDQRWADAVTAFDQVAAAKGKKADAALYWKAYALDKLGRADESRSTCDTLRRAQPQSAWNKECLVLRTRSSVLDAKTLADIQLQTDEIKRQVNEDVRLKIDRVYVNPQPNPQPNPQVRFHFNGRGKLSSEDDIKLLALNSLMEQEPQKALPLLKNVILSNQPIEVRSQALFVLSRSKLPEAQSLLLEVATSTKDPELQREAIQTLAVGRGKDAGPTLVTIYKQSSDVEVKRAAVNGLFIARDAPRLVDLARGEKDMSLKRDIVSQLALMHDPAATAYMEELLK